MQERALIPHTPEKVGTTPYLAPEMEVQPYRTEVDIWALGVVAHELFIGKNPFQSRQNPWTTDSAITLKRYDEAMESISLKEHIPVGNLILQMLTIYPPERSTANHRSLSEISLAIPEIPQTGSKRAAAVMTKGEH